ncbi:MAG: putative metal-binding motif-containing protein [Polyangiaceae bacterium]
MSVPTGGAIAQHARPRGSEASAAWRLSSQGQDRVNVGLFPDGSARSLPLPVRARQRKMPPVFARAFALTCCLLCAPNAALAHSAGLAATGCDGCHRGGKAPTVMLTADPPNPAIGQAITLTISVSQTNGATAGFYLTTDFDAPGVFTAIEPGTTAVTTGITHTTPRAGSGGFTVFKAQWTASQATGVAFQAYALSANGDKTSGGDGAGSSQLQLLVGCTGSTYYIDQDRDGYGSTDPAYASRKDCSPPAGYAALTGDCDDFHAQVHPGAIELCDQKDNNCDGNIDEQVVDQPFCEDKDGDGHGVVGGAVKMDCKPSAGFGDCLGDCDDALPTVYPGADEVCDGRDNNCNGKVDEGVLPVCGVGLCARYAASCTGTCTPGPAQPEVCDGYDEDCDGVVDNGTNETLCADTRQSCVLGKCVGGTDGTGGAGSMAGGAAAGGTTAAGHPGSGNNVPMRAPGGCSLSALGPASRNSAFWAVAWLILGSSLRRTRGAVWRRTVRADDALPPV